MGGIVAVAVIVQQAKFIAHINQRDATKSRNQGVAHQDALHRHVAVMVVGRLKPRERGKAAGNPFVARGFVDLKRRTLGETAGKAALVEL